MSHFYIYIPGDKAKLSDTKIGLDHLVEGAMGVPIEIGPDGKRGMLFAWTTPTDSRMAYSPDEQNWVPSIKQGDLESGVYWFGYWKDSKPVPGDLKRKNQCEGVEIELFGGNRWLIPHGESLPSSLRMTNDGTIDREIHEKYHSVYLLINNWKSILILREKRPLEEYFLFIYELLKLNYRIVPELINELKLINDQDVHVPVIAAVAGVDAANYVETAV